MEMYYTLSSPSLFRLIGKRHWRKSTWLDNLVADTGEVFLCSYVSGPKQISSFLLLSFLDYLFLLNKCLVPHYHLLSQAPAIHLDWNICRDSPAMTNSLFTYSRQKVQQILWRSVHCLLILLGYCSECNLPRFLSEVAARLEVLPLLGVSENTWAKAG